MVEILENYGGWPVVKGNNWKPEHWEWMDANRNISNDGLDDALLFALAVLTDQKNSSRRVLDVSVFRIANKFHLKNETDGSHFSLTNLISVCVWNSS